MNKMLLEQLHRYTEDREIDYSSAQYLGESFGIVWKNQQQLVEFKQVIDTYLKTFSLENFAIVESKLNVLTGKNTRSTEEAEQLTVYAAEPKTLRKPEQRKVFKNKKKVNEERSYHRGPRPLGPADNKTTKKFDEEEYEKTRKNSIVDYQKKKKMENEESERKSEIKSKIDALSPELKKHALDIYKVHPSWKASEIIDTAKLRLKKSK